MTARSQTEVLTHDDGRKATWFEVFFDLSFVVAVASLTGPLSYHDDWQGAFEGGFSSLCYGGCGSGIPSAPAGSKGIVPTSGQ